MTKRKALIFALLFAAVAGICATDTGKKVYRLKAEGSRHDKKVLDRRVLPDNLFREALLLWDIA